MARSHISLLLLSALLVLASATDTTDTQPAKLKERAVSFGASSQPRTGRLFGNLLDVLLSGFNYYDYGGDGVCPANSCPPWRCQDDSAVIHGYCCGCARPSDNVPFVTCRPDLRCPISAEPLCTD
ncbi:hypothetical protein WDU94_004956, partial [Cyamophila willieti]